MIKTSKAYRVFYSLLRALVIIAFAFSLSRLAEIGIQKIPVLSDFSADNISDLLCALLSFCGGYVTEKVKANAALKQEQERASTEVALVQANHQANIDALEAEHAAYLETIEIEHANQMEQLQKSWEQDALVRAEVETKKRTDQLRDARTTMISHVTAYMNIHDVNYKTKAQTAVAEFAALTDGQLKVLADNLGKLISASDPFDGPNNNAVQASIQQISVVPL